MDYIHREDDRLIKWSWNALFKRSKIAWVSANTFISDLARSRYSS